VAELFVSFITILTLTYFLTLLFLKKGLRKAGPMLQKSQKTNKKSVSVIICARNEEKNLPGLIECLQQQNTDQRSVEFILVNDRSEDATGILIENQVKKDARFKAINISKKAPGFGPKKFAIDKAINEAKGDVILLTDADGRPGKQWIQSISSYFDMGADMVIGYAPYIINMNGGFIKKILALEYFSHAAIATASTGLGFPITCVGTNMGYLKKVYNEIGGFGKYKSFISGDDDLFLTLVREQQKYNIYYATDKKSFVFNSPPKSFNQFINQRLRYASKGFNYPLKVTIGLSLYVFFNLALVMGLLSGFLYIGMVLYTTLVALSFKTIFEYNFLKSAARTLDDQRFIHYYFVTAIFHIPYVLFFGIFGQMQFFKWAEKSAEHGINAN
jgi:poly-beta-1,6-N-acetyl-D-glucosamine synthase